MAPPRSVIHFNFLPGPLVFDARPIWSALNKTVESGKLSPQTAEKIHTELDQTALYLGMRHHLMRRTLTELRRADLDIERLMRDVGTVPAGRAGRGVTGEHLDELRDHLLLMTDSFLFEFRSFLELLAAFVYEVLTALNKAPASVEHLSSGDTVAIVSKKGELLPNNFLLYLCDRLGFDTSWYRFLNEHRNFFTHEAAPYCAIEDLMVEPSKFEIIIMKANIIDFDTADAKDYFRLSDLHEVTYGLRDLSSAAQHYLVRVLG